MLYSVARSSVYTTRPWLWHQTISTVFFFTLIILSFATVCLCVSMCVYVLIFSFVFFLLSPFLGRRRLLFDTRDAAQMAFWQNRSISLVDMYIDNSEPTENVGQIHFSLEYDFQNTTLILKIMQVSRPFSFSFFLFFCWKISILIFILQSSFSWFVSLFPFIFFFLFVSPLTRFESSLSLFPRSSKILGLAFLTNGKLNFFIEKKKPRRRLASGASCFFLFYSYQSDYHSKWMTSGAGWGREHRASGSRLSSYSSWKGHIVQLPR